MIQKITPYQQLLSQYNQTILMFFKSRHSSVCNVLLKLRKKITALLSNKCNLQSYASFCPNVLSIHHKTFCFYIEIHVRCRIKSCKTVIFRLVIQGLHTINSIRVVIIRKILFARFWYFCATHLSLFIKNVNLP